MIHFIVPEAHDRLIREYLELWGRDVAARFEIIHAETLPSRPRFSAGTYVLAAIDQYSPGMAALVSDIHRSLAAHDGVRFLNHPTRTLQRFDLLDTLHRSRRNEFRAMRVTDDWRSLRFPVFVRDAGTHDGALSPLLRSAVDVERAIGRALVQGRSLHSLVVVEFCDTIDSNGYYRKYSAFVVGRHVIPRYLSVSREWMLKFQGSEFTTRMAQEEREYVFTNPHETELRDVFELACADYGRIDYGMKDGRIQTWEINLNPTIGRGLRKSSGKVPPDVDAIRTTAKEYFYKLFREAWEEVDLVTDRSVAFDVMVDPGIARAAGAPATPPDDWLSTLRRVLRPVKPIIAPVVTRALPFIARRAVRRNRR